MAPFGYPVCNCFLCDWLLCFRYGTDGSGSAPDQPDPQATAEQAAEFRDNVRRMAHHPSLAMYTGCNECMGLGMKILDDFVLRTVASEVRQLRHHFGPSLRDAWALYNHTHAVYYALLGYHAYWMLIGACDPMLRPIYASGRLAPDPGCVSLHRLLHGGEPSHRLPQRPQSHDPVVAELPRPAPAPGAVPHHQDPQPVRPEAMHLERHQHRRVRDISARFPSFLGL